MLHFTALIQNIARMKNPAENLEISYQTNEFGFWGDIKDSKNSEFYTPNNDPYENIPPDQYGFWGLFKDSNSKVDENLQLNSNDEFNIANDEDEKTVSDQANNLGNKCVNNLLNIVKLNDNKKFDYKCKFTIDKVKYKKSNDNHEAKSCSSVFNDSNLYEEELIINGSKIMNITRDNSNSTNKRIDFLHLSNIFSEDTDDEKFLHNLNQIKSVCDALTQKYNPVKLYCGDILFPSYDNLSTFHKTFNSIKFHAGIYGLNDIRSNAFSLLEESVDKTNSIWLMSNLFQVKKQYLAITKCSIMMIVENKNVKIGIIGLMHSNDLNQNQIKYFDYLQEANRLSRELTKRDVNIIIALTQMSWQHDEYLANNAAKIDLIFGCGDDNCDYQAKEVNKRWIVKSGVNQKNLSIVRIEFNEHLNKIVDVNIIKVNIKEKKV